jgi:acetyl-CoA carboxylase biotin carboxyl carrier protein
MKFSLDNVRAVAQLLGEAQLSEIVVESTDEAAPARLLVRRDMVVANAPSDAHAPVLEVASPVLDSQTPESVEVAPTTITIMAPVVGFFRHAKKPVGEGATVKAGQTVGVVESLKVPNEVTAPLAGRVVELLAQDGQGVEYQQPLFVIEPES